MRGKFEDQGGMFSYVSPEARVPKDHPLRNIRELVRDVLGDLNRALGALYSKEGRPSIPPEQLLRALLLQYKVLFLRDQDIKRTVDPDGVIRSNRPVVR